MPIKKAAFKALRQTKKRTIANRQVKLTVKKIIKETLALKDKTKVAEALRRAYKIIDKAAKKGVIKKNAAARKKSRLVKNLKKAGLF